MRNRYGMWEEIRRMQQRIDELVDRMFSSDPFVESEGLLEGPLPSRWEVVEGYKRPALDLWETDSEIIAEVEMPGLDKKDIQVSVDKDGVTIKAEKKVEARQEDRKKGMYRLERSYSGFYRRFSLPPNADPDKAKAEYKDGVLRISIPKTSKEESKKKMLEVK